MSIKKTITSIFMVPTLKISKEHLTNNGFINGYSGDINKETNFPNSVYLLFKPENIEKFRDFLEGEYERTQNIIEDYDYPDGYVVIIYKLNVEFLKDFDLIKKGQYSKVSDIFKKLFPEKVSIPSKTGINKEETSIQYRIFNKTKDLINYWENKIGIKFSEQQEVWEGYEEDKEILYINNLNN